MTSHWAWWFNSCVSTSISSTADERFLIRVLFWEPSFTVIHSSALCVYLLKVWMTSQSQFSMVRCLCRLRSNRSFVTCALYCPTPCLVLFSPYSLICCTSLPKGHLTCTVLILIHNLYVTVYLSPQGAQAPVQTVLGKTSEEGLFIYLFIRFTCYHFPIEDHYTKLWRV